jgi:hypothetical protein
MTPFCGPFVVCLWSAAVAVAGYEVVSISMPMSSIDSSLIRSP